MDVTVIICAPVCVNLPPRFQNRAIGQGALANRKMDIETRPNAKKCLKNETIVTCT